MSGNLTKPPQKSIPLPYILRRFAPTTNGYGSPKKPALAEALALNLADNADAKMQTLTEIFKGKTGHEWLGYNKLFESNLRRTSGV